MTKKIRVLIVEDDVDVAESFRDSLESKGIEVVAVAKNGKFGEVFFKKFAPDVVLMDMIMPNYDGFYALEKIRKYDPDSLIIATTADLRSETEKKLIELKISKIIYKPYDNNDIVNAINDVLDGKIELSPSSKKSHYY